MDLDFSDIFRRYETLVAAVDKTFEAVKASHGAEVACSQGCADCCTAVFDLSLVEAMYLNEKFGQVFGQAQSARQAVLDRAETAERQQAKLARLAQKKWRQGAAEEQVLDRMALQRVRCPLLDAENSCELYEHRPITCRLYGIPQAIRGQTRTCGLSGFEPGRPYPTVQLERIQDALVEMSLEMTELLKTKFRGLPTMHLPLASALLTTFDEEFFKSGSAALALQDDEEPMVDEAFFGPGGTTANAAFGGPFVPPAPAQGSPFAAKPSPFAQAPKASCGCGGETARSPECACGPGGCKPEVCGCEPKAPADTGGCSGSPLILEFDGHTEPAKD